MLIKLNFYLIKLIQKILKNSHLFRYINNYIAPISISYFIDILNNSFPNLCKNTIIVIQDQPSIGWGTTDSLYQMNQSAIYWQEQYIIALSTKNIRLSKQTINNVRTLNHIIW